MAPQSSQKRTLASGLDHRINHAHLRLTAFILAIMFKRLNKRRAKGSRNPALLTTSIANPKVTTIEAYAWATEQTSGFISFFELFV